MGTACAVLLAAVAGTAAVPARAAAPVEASCGATLTTDAYLGADLVCTEGLTVAADLTLDLNGHRLRGPVTQLPTVGPAAISISGGSAVTIRNGRIERWGQAVSTGPYQPEPDAEAPASLTVSVQQVTVATNSIGLAAGDFIDRQVAVTFDVTGSRFERNIVGISSDNAGPFSVRRSVFVDNVSAGIYAYGRSAVTLTGSRISGGRTGLSCRSSCTVTGTRLERSRTAVELVEGTLTSEDSVLSANGTGLSVSYLASADLRRTTVKANKTGVLVGQYVVLTSAQSSFTGNEVALTSRKVDVNNPLAYNVSLTDNLWSRNEDAVLLRRDPDSTLQLQGNRALRNTRYGIYAPAATDLGGNQAAGNGRACVGVVCQTP